MNRSFNSGQRPRSGFHYGQRPHFAPLRHFAQQQPSDFSAPFAHNASSKEFWCETCDRDFRSLQQLEVHKQQHQKCNIDGCQFIAHPNVITKHIQMQHSTGLFKKIGNLNNPEDIKKWREERKKKYPTQSNIEKKAAEIKEKISRGEKLGLKTDRNTNKQDLKRRYNNAFPNERLSRGKRNFNKRPNTNQSSTELRNVRNRKRPPPNVIINVPDESKTLKPFFGIQDLSMDSDEDVPESPETNFVIEDDESDDETPIKTESDSNTTVCGALTNLICNYASSDEEDNNITNKITSVSLTNVKAEFNRIKEISEPSTANITSQDMTAQKNNVSDDEEAPDEVKTEKSSGKDADSANASPVIPKKVSVIPLRHQLNNSQSRHLNKRFRRMPPSTLLQKLLFKEMQQERNMVLQCIRHIVKKNYFDATK